MSFERDEIKIEHTTVCGESPVSVLKRYKFFISQRILFKLTLNKR